MHETHTIFDKQPHLTGILNSKGKGIKCRGGSINLAWSATNSKLRPTLN